MYCPWLLCAAVAELSSCDSNHMTCKAKTTYCLVLYRKRFADPYSKGFFTMVFKVLCQLSIPLLWPRTCTVEIPVMCVFSSHLSCLLPTLPVPFIHCPRLSWRFFFCKTPFSYDFVPLIFPLFWTISSRILVCTIFLGTCVYFCFVL